ncbi:MAG TPA: DUF488 domain-containing protein [Vicinamibacterales bacterium]|nr:DUF488 domain-containing protein [Vicinamibacterales bacterium]
MEIWTIGHSNQPLNAFVDALRAHRIALLVDVRRFPSSRRLPHFNSPPLAAALERHGFDYVHMEDLGGRRPPRRDSHNIAWQNAGFRGYADYMETPAFAAAIERLLTLASERRTAIMCAERLWRQCHRGLIADELKARGHTVTHILSATASEPHPYTPAARVVEGRVSYRGILE